MSLRSLHAQLEADDAQYPCWWHLRSEYVTYRLSSKTFLSSLDGHAVESPLELNLVHCDALFLGHRPCQALLNGLAHAIRGALDSL